MQRFIQFVRRTALAGVLVAVANPVLAVLPAQFIANQGQVAHPEVDFYSPLALGRLFVKDNGDLVYSIQGRSSSDRAFRWAFQESFTAGPAAQASPGHPARLEPRGARPDPARIFRIGGTADAAPAGSNGPVQLSAFRELHLGERYAGIEVRLLARGEAVEKRFYLAPGAKVERISVQLTGIEAVSLEASGALRISAGGNSLFFTRPLAFQWIDGEKVEVAAAYRVDGDRYGFRVGAYDESRELIIDPLLASTYLGGSNANPAWTGNYDRDIAYAVQAGANSVYVAGVTQSTDFPLLLGYDETPDAYGRPDGFVARFSADLGTLLSATLLGTDYFDSVRDMALDTDGTVVVVGQGGYGFPVTPGAFNHQGSVPVGGGFVARLSADLSSLLTAAVVTPSEYPATVALGNGMIYFGGRTNNPNFPITANAYQSTCCPAGSFGIREYDGFAGKLSADLATLASLTYISGDGISDIAVGDDSSVYLTDGMDNSITGYLDRFDSDLGNLLAQVAFYPGSSSGSSRHYFNAVTAVAGGVVTAGQTYLNDLPATSGAFDTQCGSDGDCDNSSSSFYIPKPDGFVARYSADLQTLQALTYFGGNDADAVRSLAVAANGDVSITGETYSTDLATSANAAQGQCSGGCAETDVFVARLTGDLGSLLYGSYLGGGEADSALALALVAADRALVAGQTASANFPVTAGAFDTSYAGGSSGVNDSDAFVSLFDTSGSGGGGNNSPPVAVAGPDLTVGPRQNTLLDGSASTDADGSIVAYLWKQISGKNVAITNANQAVANFTSPRVRRGRVKILKFELTVTDDQGAVDTDSVTVTVRR